MEFGNDGDDRVYAAERIMKKRVRRVNNYIFIVIAMISTLACYCFGYLY